MKRSSPASTSSSVWPSSSPSPLPLPIFRNTCLVDLIGLTRSCSLRCHHVLDNTTLIVLRIDPEIDRNVVFCAKTFPTAQMLWRIKLPSLDCNRNVWASDNLRVIVWISGGVTVDCFGKTTHTVHILTVDPSSPSTVPTEHTVDITTDYQPAASGDEPGWHVWFDKNDTVVVVHRLGVTGLPEDTTVVHSTHRIELCMRPVRADSSISTSTTASAIKYKSVFETFGLPLSSKPTGGQRGRELLITSTSGVFLGHMNHTRSDSVFDASYEQRAKVCILQKLVWLGSNSCGTYKAGVIRNYGGGFGSGERIVRTAVFSRDVAGKTNCVTAVIIEHIRKRDGMHCLCIVRRGSGHAKHLMELGSGWIHRSHPHQHRYQWAVCNNDDGNASVWALNTLSSQLLVWTDSDEACKHPTEGVTFTTVASNIASFTISDDDSKITLISRDGVISTLDRHRYDSLMMV